jgi:hypothetical protein
LKIPAPAHRAGQRGASDNNRRAKFYRLTRASHKRLEKESRQSAETTGIIARFFVREST